MRDAFRPLFENLDRASDHMRDAGQDMLDAFNEMAAANTAIHSAINVALDAREEHEDLRVTVTRLEGLVMAQIIEIRDMREQMKKQQGNGS